MTDALLRSSCPADAETVILALLGVVRGFGPKDRGYMSLVIDGRQHTPRCPYGQWLTPKEPGEPKGDPCSDRCETAQQAVDWAVAWLWANRPASIEAPVQAPLFNEVAG